MPIYEKQRQRQSWHRRPWTKLQKPSKKWCLKSIEDMPKDSMNKNLIDFHQKEHGITQLISFLTHQKPWTARYIPWLEEKKIACENSVEFVGPQQPNGEMAQWGNMPQRGNMAQRGKCGSTLENDWGLNPGPPGYILGALTTELYGPEYRVLVSDSYQLCDRLLIQQSSLSCYLQLDFALLLICVSVQRSKSYYLIRIA